MEALSPSETSEQPVLTESQQSATPSGTQRDADRPTSPQTDANVMDPDDPILARTQAALKRQLEASQLRLQGEVREKAKLLSDAKKHREATGVDLFNFQQQLARLQMDLEKAHDHHTSIAAAKEAAEARVRGLRAQHDDELRAVKDERVRTDKFQEELDRQAATLRQIEAYNEEMKNEIAVTRRATYKAEEAVQRLEAEKSRQDRLIEQLQDNLKGLHQAATLRKAQVEAQKGETRAAMETLVEAEQEMEAIHFEKRQLIAQWHSALLAIGRREGALAAIRESIHKQDEQERSIANELARFRKDVREQQVQQEMLTGIMGKLERDLASAQRNCEAATAKGEHAAEEFAKLERAQAAMDERLARCAAERRALEAEVAAVDKAFMRAAAQNVEVEERMVAVLGEQTTVEKGAGGTAKAIQRLRKDVRAKELKVVSAQNEIAKLSVDVLNTESHNVKLADTLALLDGELRDKAAVVERFEAEVRRRNDEIEKKTRAVDALNRKLEKLLYNMDGEDTGPLEATIRNLQRELQKKEAEGKELQRHWIVLQTELVARQNENGRLTESQARLTSNFSILYQKKVALENELAREQAQVKDTERQLARHAHDMTRLNTLISKHQATAATLEDEAFNLQRSVVCELKELEQKAAKLERDIEAAAARKKGALDGVLDAERQIMLWERKLQLEKEMQDILDPSVGQDVLGSMKKEIHRMELRQGELGRTKEALVTELERAIEKRDTISVKGRAAAVAAKRHAGRLTEAQLVKKCDELKRSVADTEAECAATDARVAALDRKRAALADAMEATALACGELRERDAAVAGEVQALVATKTARLLATARLAAAAAALEGGASAAPPDGDAEGLRREQEGMVSVVERLANEFKDAAPMLRRTLLHAQALEAL